MDRRIARRQSRRTHRAEELICPAGLRFSRRPAAASLRLVSYRREIEDAPAGSCDFRLATLSALLLAVLAGPAAARTRRAGVGNSAYQNIARLDNPSNDAGLMADTLRALASRWSWPRPARPRQAGPRRRGAKLWPPSPGRRRGAVLLCRPRGSGQRSNYLVPVGANPTREADVEFQMVDIDLVLRQMQGSGTRLKMVISMHAAIIRRRPRMRASDGGLAQMRAPEGTLISYATQPGSVAQDGSDGHSPYTKALAATIRPARARSFRPSTGRPCRETRDRRIATALGIFVADRRHVLFRRPRSRIIAAGGGAPPCNRGWPMHCVRSRPRTDQGCGAAAGTERSAL